MKLLRHGSFRQLGETSQKKNCVNSKIQTFKKLDLLQAVPSQTFWQRITHFFFPYLKKSQWLAEAYAEAQVKKVQNEARKISEQDDEIASRKCLTQQKEVQEFCCTVDNIFADDGLPPAAKVLKLAKLIEKNPQVTSHLKEVKDLLDKLSPQESLNKEFENKSYKQLPQSLIEGE